MRQGYYDLLIWKTTIPKSTEVLDSKMEQEKIKAKEANGIGYSELILSMDTSQPAGLVALICSRRVNQKNMS